MRTKFWSGNLKVRNRLEDLGVDRRIMLDWMLGKEDGKVWTGFIWLRAGTSDRLSQTRSVMNLRIP
jgi:hypothetical protein